MVTDETGSSHCLTVGCDAQPVTANSGTWANNRSSAEYFMDDL
jgi:hypothetical protein